MKYELEFKPRAVKDLKKLEREFAARIVAQLEGLAEGLTGDVKKLTAMTPEYRLRVGEYRVLFELDSNKIIVYRVVHRREAYR